MDRLDFELIEKSTFSNPWDLGNKVLYDLCYNHFGHDTIEKVVNKVWLIGRAYAATVERRKSKNAEFEMNDFFYLDTVGPTLRESELDQRLKELNQIEELSADKVKILLETHNYLVTILKGITNLTNRSFSSKYLHFHLPKLYYIYDSRATLALRMIKRKTGNNPKQLALLDNVDKVYASFFLECHDLTEQIKDRHRLQLSPRQLDNLLLEIAHKELRMKVASKKSLSNSGLLLDREENVRPVTQQEPAAKRSKKSTSTEEKITFLKPLIESGRYTQLELVEKARMRFPSLKESTISTFLTDANEPEVQQV